MGWGYYRSMSYNWLGQYIINVSYSPKARLGQYYSFVPPRFPIIILKYTSFRKRWYLHIVNKNVHLTLPLA